LIHPKGQSSARVAIGKVYGRQEKGHVFKTDPTGLSPDMTGDEFAAVVATLPMADQQAISTKLREMVQERDQ
jgi:hypothetical protein